MNEVKTDCFAYLRGNCRALEKLYCAEGKCNFYKKCRCDGGCKNLKNKDCNYCKKVVDFG